MSPSRSESNFNPTGEVHASLSAAFLCDNDGRITGDSGGTITERLQLDLAEPDSFMKFLESVRSRGTTLGWEMSIRDGGTASSLLLHGSLTPRGILVYATLTPSPAPSPEYEDALRLMSAVVHDFKNPISTIISSCEYLEEYSPENLDPQQWEMIRSIHSAAATLLRLSSSILQL
jgi:hypothetical protein